MRLVQLQGKMRGRPISLPKPIYAVNPIVQSSLSESGAFWRLSCSKPEWLIDTVSFGLRGPLELWRPPVSCKSCNSTNQSRFPAEIVIHFPGVRDLDRSQVWAFPSLLVCFDCGFTEFVIDEEERKQLTEPDSANEGSRSFT